MTLPRKGTYITQEQVDQLRLHSFESRQSESEIIRQALDLYFEELKGKGKADPDQLSAHLDPEVWEAVNRLAVEKNVDPLLVIEIALKKQVPQKYFE
jgi:hypothetical protein